ncbi:MAG: glycosyltransferase family 2 protein [Anaerolineales bacterium]|nr:glycosyltransferase family 2 protein [Anaerolineales bacterium]
MIRRFLTLASWLTAGVLLIFTVRRWLFILAALPANNPFGVPFGRRAGRRPLAAKGVLAAHHRPSELPPVLLLVPLRNEAESLPGLLAALAALDYPADRLTGVLINDGSTDGSERIIENWIRGRDNWRLLSLGQNVGKAQALNSALAAFPQGEIVAVYDADERPQPTALRYLVSPFSGKKIGAVSGRRAVCNSLASPAASYTTFEGLVHQWITLRAKDRLNLAPAILGANCAYRRTALAEVGTFEPGALLEDSDLTLKLARTGWTIRFEPRAVSYHRVPRTLAGYWRQHTRWARGFNEVAKNQARSTLAGPQLSWPLRLELLAFSLGYLDRLALLAGAGLALLHPQRRKFLLTVVAASLLTPLFQIMAALAIGREPMAMWLRIIWLPFFFGVDMAMAAVGMWQTLKQSPQIWEERHARK